MNKKDLPVEILENDLPKDNTYKNKTYLDNDFAPKSSGFTSLVFLASIMGVSFLWGMLTMMLKGA